MRKTTPGKAAFVMLGLWLALILRHPAPAAGVAGADPNQVVGAASTQETPAQTTWSSPVKQTPLEDLIRKDSVSTVKLVGRFLVAMAFVGVLAVAAFYLSRRVGPRFVRSQGKELAVVETLDLGSRRAVHLLRVGASRRILVGSTADRITYLADVSDLPATIPGDHEGVDDA